MSPEDSQEKLNSITEGIIGAAIEVHRHLGPGLLESAYQRCLAHELKLRAIEFDQQKIIHIDYKDISVADAYRLDLYVQNAVVVEIKAIDTVADVHRAQLLTYMRAVSAPLGLLINFNHHKLIDGVQRMKI